MLIGIATPLDVMSHHVGDGETGYDHSDDAACDERPVLDLHFDLHVLIPFDVEGG
jgi:hypothetical protein